MIPAQFPEANTKFTAPGGMDESQVMTLPAYLSPIAGGNLDGACVCVAAWRPTPEEIQKMIDGEPIFLSFLGGMPPHFPTMEFGIAANPGRPVMGYDCPECSKRTYIAYDHSALSVRVTCRSCGHSFNGLMNANAEGE